jgi:hypothetical protein
MYDFDMGKIWEREGMSTQSRRAPARRVASGTWVRTIAAKHERRS